jgi:hypothetical protein
MSLTEWFYVPNESSNSFNCLPTFAQKHTHQLPERILE